VIDWRVAFWLAMLFGVVGFFVVVVFFNK